MNISKSVSSKGRKGNGKKANTIPWRAGHLDRLDQVSTGEKCGMWKKSVMEVKQKSKKNRIS